MYNLSKMRMFRLLSEPSQVTNEEMKNAYEDFVEQVSTLSQSEIDYSKVFRILSFTRIEFNSLGSSSLYGQEKNVLKNSYLRKTILFLESEIDLLKLQTQHPAQIPPGSPYSFKSVLSLIPKSKNLGVMGITEILTSLDLLQGNSP